MEGRTAFYELRVSDFDWDITIFKTILNGTTGIEYPKVADRTFIEGCIVLEKEVSGVVDRRRPAANGRANGIVIHGSQNGR